MKIAPTMFAGEVPAVAHILLDFCDNLADPTPIQVMSSTRSLLTCRALVPQSWVPVEPAAAGGSRDRDHQSDMNVQVVYCRETEDSVSGHF